jgi:iron complex outermembrane receptor protein
MLKSFLKQGASMACLMIVTAGTAYAQQVASADTADTIETITIITSGSSRQIQSIDNEALLEAAPGTSPIKEIALLPGVNFTGSDSFGAYEWSTRISVRGFNQNQLGFTLDGIPLGDMSYGAWNGLHISRAIIDENIDKVSISQGAGSLGTASNSNLGGTVQFFSSAPADKFGGTISESTGSFGTERTYGRVDSGLLPSGTKFTVSADYDRSLTWKGDFPQRYWQINSKLEQKIGENNTLTAFFNYSDRRENDYQDLSLNYIKTLGYNVTNYANYNSFIQAAAGYHAAAAGQPYAQYFTHGETLTNDPFDVSYGGSSGIRMDSIGGLTLDSTLGDDLSVKTTVYGHGDHGGGIWITPYVPSFATGAPGSERESGYKIQREGVTSDVTWTGIRNNTVTGGVWFENDVNHNFQNYYNISSTTPPNTLELPRTAPELTAFDTRYDVTVIQGYVQDNYDFGNGLIANAGFKGISTEITAHQLGGFQQFANGKLTAADGFLPQIGASWKVTPEDEFFVDVAKNMRSYQSSNGLTPFQTVQSTFDNLNLHPETSWTEEGGYRMTRGAFSATATGYHVDFSNRLVSIQNCPAIVGCASGYANEGGVSTNGAEISGTAKLLPGLSLYDGLSYNRSTYNNNLTTGGVVYNLSGKTVIDTPDLTDKAQISYHRGGFYGDLSMTYMGKRYFTYTNSQSVPSYKTFDLTVGYDLTDIPKLQDVRFQFNVTNLFNEIYISTIGTTGFPLVNDSDTLQVGAPRAFFGTISAKF